MRFHRPDRNRWPQILIIVSAAAALVGVGGAGALLLGGHLGTPDTTAPSTVDIGFAQDMSVHHSQAIAMADIVTGNPDPAITTLAQGIKITQVEQIGRMQGFLALWNAPTLPSGPPMEWMHTRSTSGPDHSDMRHMGEGMAQSPIDGADPERTGMPGMASQAQLQHLRDAKDRDQAVLFLQLMLRHHLGGISMAQFAANNAQLPQTKALAAQMSFDQTQENQLIGQLLMRYGTDPRTPPPQ